MTCSKLRLLFFLESNILLNIERLELFGKVVILFELLSLKEINPESPKEDDRSLFTLSNDPNGLVAPERIRGLDETLGTGLTPKIDFKAVVDSSRLEEALENTGFKGVEVDWVVEGAILALNILGISSVLDLFILVEISLSERKQKIIMVNF